MQIKIKEAVELAQPDSADGWLLANGLVVKTWEEAEAALQGDQFCMHWVLYKPVGCSADQLYRKLRKLEAQGFVVEPAWDGHVRVYGVLNFTAKPLQFGKVVGKNLNIAKLPDGRWVQGKQSKPVDALAYKALDDAVRQAAGSSVRPAGREWV